MTTKLAKSSSAFRSCSIVTVVAFVILSIGLPINSTGFAILPGPSLAGPTDMDPPDSLTQLRDDIDGWIGKGTAADGFEPLAKRARDLIEHESDPGELLSILHESSRLCWHGPTEPTRALRAWSLNQLVEMPAESSRARTMLRSQFLPPLHRIVPERQLNEVNVFDELVDKLATQGVPKEFSADLTYAKSLLRVEVNRAWNASWLDQRERDRTIDSLRKLAADLGDVVMTNSKTYSEVVAGDIRELQELAFGSPTPGMTLTDLQNVEFELKHDRGKVVVLIFWSSWCVPCLARVPEEKDMQNGFAGDPFELIGVNSDQAADVARRTAEQRNMTWRNVWDGSGSESSMGKYFAIRGLPSAIVLDREGRICGKFVGSIFNQDFTTNDIQRIVETALGKQHRAATKVADAPRANIKMKETNAEPGSDEAADTNETTLTAEESQRYTEVAKKLIMALNSEDKKAYRALFTDASWESAIPWFREMFATQISSFGRIKTAYAPRRGLVRVTEKMSFRGGSESSVAVMVKFENGMGGALSFELNADNKIVSSSVFIKQELAEFDDKTTQPIFELN